jgi:branched-chain amino acid transport system permease protein
LIGSLLVGLVDTASRSLLPLLLRQLASAELAANLGPALASILIYVLMAAILFWKPSGLFPARG